MRLSTKSGRVKGLAAAAIALAVVFTPVSGAQAGTTVKKAGGGLWEYGVENIQVFSNYHHAKKYHSATACDGSIIRHCAKKSAAPGKWAKAAKGATYVGGNTAYWDTY